MGAISGVLTYVAFTALFFYILYFVVRAAVRDGVRAARQGQGGPTSP
ncbi:hypothetical protein ACWGRK_01290 [Saccharomonospora azurea]|uniref:Uncharacterized protein n=1 Tax=Saccharomonospora azurea NA-128 TaxID=882081 RepID=H8GEQ4_9PSEU|nr:hypothetical protein [Saccharomonospora azurea]EHY89965.1 hypothetical protein SacazDRAFT_03083 [Saccharomonospora azurea NA-128]